MQARSHTQGRPRSPDIDQRILDAAYALLAQGGYAHMSIDAVAGEAGVAKPTIYLRYPDKAALATAAISAHQLRETVVETGETHTDLAAYLRLFRADVARVSLMGSVIAEEHETPELLDLFRRSIIQPRRLRLRAILDRARARGEIAPDADIDAAVTLLAGAHYAQYLAGELFPSDWAERMVTTVLIGLHPARA